MRLVRVERNKRESKKKDQQKDVQREKLNSFPTKPPHEILVSGTAMHGTICLFVYVYWEMENILEDDDHLHFTPLSPAHHGFTLFRLRILSRRNE